MFIPFYCIVYIQSLVFFFLYKSFFVYFIYYIIYIIVCICVIIYKYNYLHWTGKTLWIGNEKKDIIWIWGNKSFCLYISYISIYLIFVSYIYAFSQLVICTKTHPCVDPTVPGNKPDSDSKYKRQFIHLKVLLIFFLLIGLCY